MKCEISSCLTNVTIVPVVVLGKESSFLNIRNANEGSVGTTEFSRFTSVILTRSTYTNMEAELLTP